jgi:hypothetical protein
MIAIERHIRTPTYSISQLRTEMITRRALISTGLASLFAGASARAAFAEPASTSDPVAIVTPIYTRAARAMAAAAS